MRTTAAALALVLVVLVAGCGGSGDEPAKPEDVVAAYHGAIADGDARKACEQLAPAAQKQLQDSTQGAARGSCQQVIELLSGFYDRSAKEAVRKARVTITISGDSAKATFNAPLGLGGPPQEQSYTLGRTDGDWKIEKLEVIAG